MAEVLRVYRKYQVPPEQRLATSLVVKPEGKASNRGPKPGGNKDASSVLSVEICIFVVTG